MPVRPRGTNNGSTFKEAVMEMLAMQWSITAIALGALLVATALWLVAEHRQALKGDRR